MALPMNMAFTTNVYRNGRWVTEDVTFDKLLARPDSNHAKKPVTKAPEYGVLTTTIVDSPLVHTILPVRLRSATHVDVAFIGDHFLQICELQTTAHDPTNVDCQYHLEDIARKTDLGSRIRSAKVIGAIYDGDDKTGIKDEKSPETGSRLGGLDEDLDMIGGSLGPSSSQQSSRMPPQLLSLVLENGDCVFLCMREDETGDWHFEVSTFTGPENRLWNAGFHFAVDPSSRYMALGCHQDLFVIYELETRETLERRFAEREPLNPVKIARPRTLNGAIHKMEFLFPNPADDYHVILLLITIRDGRSRSIIYDWEVEDDLKDVLAQEKKGHSLPQEHQMPLLIIPLAVCSAFFAISQDSIAVCKDILEGPPSFENFELQPQAPTAFHHGNANPLWTAWARPLRSKDHSHEAGHDHIYLAREDGALIFLEIDSENILGATVSLGLLNGNIATALGSVPAPFADILLMGGDSGPGAMYEIRPRGDPRPIMLMPNWSPAVDFATTDSCHHSGQGAKETEKSTVSWNDTYAITRPNADRVFAASGRGLKGSITEFRTAIQGVVKTHLEVEQPVKKIWMLPTMVTEGNLHVLITMPGRSMLLLAPEDLSDDVTMVEDEESRYDLSSPTLAAAEIDNSIVQLTEKFLVIISPGGQRTYRLAELFDAPDMVVLDAVVHGSFIVLSTHVATAFQLRVLSLNADRTPVVHGSSDVEGEVTCISCVDLGGRLFLVAGIYDNNESILSLLSVHDVGASFSARYKVAKPDLNEAVNVQHPSAYRRFDDRVNSIVCLPSQDQMIVIAGSRFGEVVTLSLEGTTDGSFKLLTSHYDKVGSRSVQLCLIDESPLNPSPSTPKVSVIACCNHKAVLMSRLCPKTHRFRDMHNIFPIELDDETRATMNLHSANVPRQTLLHRGCGTSVLFASGTAVVLVELQPVPRAIPRVLPLRATPQKLIYIAKLDCLVVAVTVNNKLALRFLDPDTGADLSKPGRERREEERVDAGSKDDPQHISGLHTPRDVVLDLSEWDFKRPDDKKDAATWTYILVCLRSGALLILSTKTLPAEEGQPRGKINFWTRLKKRFLTSPVQCALGVGENLFYCAGTALHWEKLDPIAKELVPVDNFELRSPATTLKLINGHIVALTERDSIHVISLAGDLGRPLPAGSGPTTSGQSLLTSLRHSAPEGHDGAIHMIELMPHEGSNTGEGNEMEIEEDNDNSSGKDTEDLLSSNPEEKTIILLSDRSCGVTAQAIPWQQPGKNCLPVMNARLPASIRKFARGRTRPCWEPVRTPENAQYGVIPTRADGAEVLGLCLDGSIQHFSLVDVKAWHVLCLVQNTWLGREYRERRNEGDRDVTDPFAEDRLPFDELMSPAELLVERHVDGDVLRRALLRRELKDVLKAWPAVTGRMNALLEDMLGDEYLGESKDKLDDMVHIVYQILEYHLAPVLVG